MSERDEARSTLKALIITALANSAQDVKENPVRAWDIMSNSILDQLSQPQASWALKELAKPTRKY